MKTKYNLIVGSLETVVFEGYFRKDRQGGQDCWWCNRTGVGYDQNGEQTRTIFASWVKPVKISKPVFDGLVDSISKVKKLKDIYITSARAISNAGLKGMEIKTTK